MRTSWQTFQHAWAKVFGLAKPSKYYFTFDVHGVLINSPDPVEVLSKDQKALKDYRIKCVRRNNCLIQREQVDSYLQKVSSQDYDFWGGT